MSSLLNKFKGHKRETSTDANDSYNQSSPTTGYDNTATSGYGNTSSPTHRGETGFGNTQNTSSGYNDGPLTSHSDGGRYHPPKGSAVGQGYNTESVGPHSSTAANRLDPRVDSDQSRLQKSTHQGHGEPGYNQSGINQSGYGNTAQGPHSSNLANKADPRVDSDSSRGNYGYGTTTTTTTNTSTSIEHGDHDSNKRLPADPNHPTLMEKANPKVETAADRARQPYDGTGHGNTTSSQHYGNTPISNQYGSTHESNKRLPEDPNHPTLMEKANPKVDTDRRDEYGNTGYGNTTDSSRRHEQPGYGAAGHGTTAGTDQYDRDGKKLPKDPNHPTMMEKANPKVDTDRSNEYGSTGYGNTTDSSRRHEQPGYGAAGYGTTAGTDQYDRDGKKLPKDPNHPTMMEKVNPKVDTDRSNEYGSTGYGNTTDSSRRHEQPGYGAAGYGTTAGTDQYDRDGKKLPKDPNHPTMMEKANPKVDTDRRDEYGNITDSSRRHEQPGYGAAGYGHDNDSSRRHEQSGYGTTAGTDQYGSDGKKLPKDPNHPTMMEKLNPKVDTDASHRNEYDNPSTTYNNATTTSGPHSSNIANRGDPRVDSDNSRHHHGHHDQYDDSSRRHEQGYEREHGHHNRDTYGAGAAAAGAGAGAYAGHEHSRHHQSSAVPVANDDSTMMNRSHPSSSMHPSDQRYDSSRTNQQTGADGEYLPGPAPATAGPHKSDMLNKLDPRVDSDQSKLEKEREREGYGSTGTGIAGATAGKYGNEHERRINENPSRRHDGTGLGSSHHNDQYSNSPTSTSHRDRDSGYGNSNVSSLPHRKAVGESGTGTGGYLRDSENPASSNYDRSGAGAAGSGLGHGQGQGQGYGSTTTGQGYGSSSAGRGYNHNNNDTDENDFECAKCGHHNTHLRKNRNNKVDEYGNQKPSMMEKLNPKVDSNHDGKAGFMK